MPRRRTVRTAVSANRRPLTPKAPSIGLPPAVGTRPVIDEEGGRAQRGLCPGAQCSALLSVGVRNAVHRHGRTYAALWPMGAVLTLSALEPDGQRLGPVPRRCAGLQSRLA